MTEAEMIEFLKRAKESGDLPTEPNVNVSARYDTPEDKPEDRSCHFCTEPARTGYLVITAAGDRWLSLCPVHYPEVSKADQKLEAESAGPAESHLSPPAGESTQVDRCTMCSDPMKQPFATFTMDWPTGPELQRLCTPTCAKAAFGQWKDRIDDPGPRGYGDWTPPR